MGVGYRGWGLSLLSAAILWSCLGYVAAAATGTAAQYRQLGLSYRQQERFPEAIAALEKSAVLEPNAANRVLLGWTQHLAGDRQGALETLVATVHQDPLHIPALNALGIICLVNGNLAEAMIVHSWATILNPQNGIAHYNLSLAYHRRQQYSWDSGNPTLAQARYAQAVDLDPRYQDPGFLSHLQAAGLSPLQIQTVEAFQAVVADR